jgi:hypothetical protein
LCHLCVTIPYGSFSLMIKMGSIKKFIQTRKLK